MWKLLLAGGLLPLAFSPLNYYPLAFIGLFILLTEWLHVKAKRAFVMGWLFGLGFFGVGISWVFVSIHRYGNTNAPLAVLITLLFIAFLALFPAIQGLIIKYLYTERPKTCLLIAFPTSWVLMEYFRGWIFTGFPWLYLGYSQFNTPLAGFAPIIGVNGISFLVVFSVGLTKLILNIHFLSKAKTIITKIIALLVLVIVWTLGDSLKNIPWTTKGEESLTVSLIQGNLAPDDKFLLEDPIQTVTEVYLKPTLEHLNSKFIIWPENSIPLPLPFSENFIAKINQLAEKNGTALLLGLPVEISKSPYQYYNSILALGTAHGIYHKKLLVPFGEYLPFTQLLRGLINFFDIPMSSFRTGPLQQQSLSIPNSKLLPQICYEIAYPEQVRLALLEQQSDAIVTISEDGWFGHSWGPWQHLDIARMRALENGRYVIRSTTSGISAIIDEKGQILKQSPQFKPYVLSGEFVNFAGLTPWTKYGQLPVIVFCGLLLVFTSIKQLLLLILPKKQY